MCCISCLSDIRPYKKSLREKCQIHVRLVSYITSMTVACRVSEIYDQPKGKKMTKKQIQVWLVGYITCITDKRLGCQIHGQPNFLMKTKNTDKRKFGWLCEVIARYVSGNQDKQPDFRLESVFWTRNASDCNPVRAYKRFADTRIGKWSRA